MRCFELEVAGAKFAEKARWEVLRFTNLFGPAKAWLGADVKGSIGDAELVDCSGTGESGAMLDLWLPLFMEGKVVSL